MNKIELINAIKTLTDNLTETKIAVDLLRSEQQMAFIEGRESKRLNGRVRNAERREAELTAELAKAEAELAAYNSDDEALKAYNEFVATEQAQMANAAPTEPVKLGTKTKDLRSEKLHLDMNRYERLTVQAAEKAQNKEAQAELFEAVKNAKAEQNDIEAQPEEIEMLPDFTEFIGEDEVANNTKERIKKMKGRMGDVVVLNDGNPVEIGSGKGYLFTVSSATAKKHKYYATDKLVPLTSAELKMPGVVVAQNRGMLFSSCRPITGKYIIPTLKGINLIVVSEKSRVLTPVEDDENKMFFMGNGERTVKDVIGDGQGQHWFEDVEHKLAVWLWVKIARFIYGGKGMLQPGLGSDIGVKVKDYWGIERTITKGNTLLMNTSMIKGIAAYASLEALIEHSEEWGLTEMMKQWQSGDHKPENKRIVGTQPQSTNLTQTPEEIEEFLKPEARQIYGKKYAEVAWRDMANVNTSRGRALAARPELMYKDLMIDQVNTKAGNMFLRLAQGKFMADAQYLKMYQDKLVYSLVYVHGMDPNEAARKAAETGLHGEIRVSPYFAGLKYEKGVDGKKLPTYTKETHLDNKGRYIETALVRYPHGAPSETIIVKAYLDATVPNDVIVFPAPAADEKGRINVKYLYALRLQGADFDGDAVTAFREKKWIEAQRRNTGKAYMIIPINTESTAKDTTLVTDETWAQFCELKVESLSNQVGLIATSLKYFMSQKADMMRNGENPEMVQYMIGAHASAMGDDIDEFKHGKAKNKLALFVITKEDGKDERLLAPYFIRYSGKFKSYESLMKASKTRKGDMKTPGHGVLDMYAVAIEGLMNKARLPIHVVKSEASDGTDRFYYTVTPAKWEARDVDLFTEGGSGVKATCLPPELEDIYGLARGTALTAKQLFEMLYRNHAATCSALMNDSDEETEEGRDAAIKAISKINERYALAKVAVMAWTKRMLAERGTTGVTAEDAIKAFTNIMVQHSENSRSIIENEIRVGEFEKKDGTKYKKTKYAAQRVFNYFLDICGDGLLLLKVNEPDFEEVPESVMARMNVKKPDIEVAKAKALKELETIEKLVNLLPYGAEVIREAIEEQQPLYIHDDDDYNGICVNEYYGG